MVKKGQHLEKTFRKSHEIATLQNLEIGQNNGTDLHVLREFQPLPKILYMSLTWSW